MIIFYCQKVKFFVFSLKFDPIKCVLTGFFSCLGYLHPPFFSKSETHKSEVRRERGIVFKKERVLSPFLSARFFPASFHLPYKKKGDCSLFFRGYWCYNVCDMAKVSYQLMPPEYVDYFKKNLSPTWRFELPRIMRTERLISRGRREQLVEQSFLGEFGFLWQSFTEQEKEAWNEAGAVCGMPGWRLFVKDQSIRKAEEFAGVAYPSKDHQARVGHIAIDSPASHIEIVQPHPKYYWRSRIVPGRYPLTELQWIHENFSLPLTISLSYKADLKRLSYNSFVYLYAWVWSVAGGRNFYTPLVLSLSLSRNWARVTKSLSNVPGVPVSYDLYFNLFDVSGDLFFDNLSVIHSGFNWAGDPFCESVEAVYSRSFFQVLRPWIPLDVPAGASFVSEYYDFGPPVADDTLGVFGLARSGLALYGRG